MVDQAGQPRAEMARSLWHALSAQLEQWRVDWRDLITTPASPPPQLCPSFQTMSDRTIFEAFSIAAISGNARWDRIADIRDELNGPFRDFSPRRFAALDDRDLDEDIVPWFRRRRAGSPRLRTVLDRLRDTAKILGCNDARSGAAFLEEALAEADGSPEGMAVLLGTTPRFKLPGFGIALAAEVLRLLGCDLCKPDRHILRAVGSWQLVRYRRWPDGPFRAPQAKPAELLATMLVVRRLANANGLGVSYATSAIWLAGAVSGARLTNLEFARLADKDGAAPR
jgi:hypothetical protein